MGVYLRWASTFILVFVCISSIIMATGGAGGDATLEDRLKNLLEAVERSNTQNEQSIARISKRFEEVADLAAKKPKLDRSSIDFKSKSTACHNVCRQPAPPTLVINYAFTIVVISF
uniref:Uncharacterized protein n=1 Tax=Amphimedon queenslandica TaxID=400682 RepID=A0A1X7UTS5_AMPQE